ncbi:MAG: hypothetical protein HFE66_08220 [Clostridiales bacterium]|jgi:hypothetical protein|nr:hypothetical protein [Clostridiales bacterium]
MRWMQIILPYLLAVLILCAGFAAAALLEHIPYREENVLTTTKMDMGSYPLYISESETLTLYPWNCYDTKKNLALTLSQQQIQEGNLQIRQIIQQLSPGATPKSEAFDPAGYLEYDQSKQYLFLKEYKYDTADGPYTLTLAADAVSAELLYYTCTPISDTPLTTKEQEQAVEQLQEIMQEAEDTFSKIILAQNDFEKKTDLKNIYIFNPLIKFWTQYSQLCVVYSYSDSLSSYDEAYIPQVFFNFYHPVQIVSYQDMLLAIGTNPAGKQLILFYEPRSGSFCGFSIGKQT